MSPDPASPKFALCPITIKLGNTKIDISLLYKILMTILNHYLPFLAIISLLIGQWFPSTVPGDHKCSRSVHQVLPQELKIRLKIDFSQK